MYRKRNNKPTKKSNAQLHIRKLRYSRKPIPSSQDLPSIMDFGITVQEAQFVTQYCKHQGDEKKAALDVGLITPETFQDQADDIINSILSNSKVHTAIDAAMTDEFKRTMLTSNMVYSQMVNMVTADPNDLFNDDGTPKPLKDIPRRTRYAINKFEQKPIFGPKTDDGGKPIQGTKIITGYTTNCQLHDKSKLLLALQDRLEGPVTSQVFQQNNQINNYGDTYITENNLNLTFLSNEELVQLNFLISKAKGAFEEKETQVIEETKQEEIPAIEYLKRAEACTA